MARCWALVAFGETFTEGTQWRVDWAAFTAFVAAHHPAFVAGPDATWEVAEMMLAIARWKTRRANRPGGDLLARGRARGDDDEEEGVTYGDGER